MQARLAVALIVLLAFIAQGFYWHGKGRESERAAWVIEQAKSEKVFNQTILDEKNKAIAAERALFALQQKMEAEANEREAKIAGLRIANGRLLTAHGGLYDKNGRSTGGGGGQAGSPATFSGGPAAGVGCVLSGKVSVDLLDLARDADLDRSTALACQAELTGVTTILNGLVKEKEREAVPQ